ncbi:hypothetical protein AGDE_14185 [Angomonas deanei]|uniref:Uncharacterized protein n=1 Tax=Angomonas deanei TaxID=59799 RepID=A0A7G2CI38_9TRYP|nr:hypothetical protein AGDE_14185 [Angomonas deanei]CAD2219518.1 hypothetical protein, conserved [Angomonas deanei]|eukprot:EPY21269.1 hypothetical protein AGDE_14185 [Angomonas deanei]
MTGGHGGATTVHGRTAGSPVIQKFLLALAQLVKTVAPLFTPTKTSRERSKSGRSKSQPHTQALEFLKTEIETALLEGVHEIMAKPRKAGRKAAPKKSSRRRVKASETPSTDSAFSSGSDSDDDESSEDDY